MFRLFARLPAPAPISPAYVVRDRYTKHVIASGTYAECDAYLIAFGQCYIEEA